MEEDSVVELNAEQEDTVVHRAFKREEYVSSVRAKIEKMFPSRDGYQDVDKMKVKLFCEGVNYDEEICDLAILAEHNFSYINDICKMSLSEMAILAALVKK